MLFRKLTSDGTKTCIDLTRYILSLFDLPLPNGVALEDCWQQFWHPTRTVEWPWALAWYEPGMKVLDIGSDPLFSLLLLREGATDVTLHHTSQDTQNLGKALIHSVGWVSLQDPWADNDRKLKMLWGYPDQFDIPDATYDIIYNLSVMEHVEPENWESWLEATWRMLKPGGLMVMTCDYLVKDASSGPSIDITNHPFEEFFLSHSRCSSWFLSSVEDIPWHPDYIRMLEHDPSVLKMQHPANPDGLYTVYGFAVRKVL